MLSASSQLSPTRLHYLLLMSSISCGYQFRGFKDRIIREFYWRVKMQSSRHHWSMIMTMYISPRWRKNLQNLLLPWIDCSDDKLSGLDTSQVVESNTEFKTAWHLYIYRRHKNYMRLDWADVTELLSWHEIKRGQVILRDQYLHCDVPVTPDNYRQLRNIR